MFSVFTSVLVFSGLFFLVVGTIGLIRFPDVYTRIHATTKCDTLGAALVILALMLNSGSWQDNIKLLLMVVFIWITNPTAAHLISKAAYKRKINMALGSIYIDKRREN
ncbi:MAG: multicomponent Na+:H+ antiporter subunit [Thermosediminibacterales bacterium]|nr:multicomponent Na+:H+ antiporter subunit [Thermosediminibacterales bacterium]